MDKRIEIKITTALLEKEVFNDSLSQKKKIVILGTGAEIAQIDLPQITKKDILNDIRRIMRSM